MKSRFVKNCLAFLALLPCLALADHATGPIQLKVLQAVDANGVALTRVMAGQPVELTLKIISNVAGDRARKVLADSDLVIRHEKLFHFFGFDRGLTNFIHEHPVYQGDGTWKVSVKFKQAGHYRLWADVALNQTPPPEAREMLPGYECTGSAQIEVGGDGVPNSELTGLAQQLQASDRGSSLKLNASELVPDEMSMLPIEFSRQDGQTPRIDPFLGAIAHFVITNLKGDKIYHVHPMEMSGMWMIHATLPSGTYRVFSQFIEHGELRTVELAIQVPAKAGS